MKRRRFSSIQTRVLLLFIDRVGRKPLYDIHGSGQGRSGGAVLALCATVTVSVSSFLRVLEHHSHHPRRLLA
jgi:hypothetical protein